MVRITLGIFFMYATAPLGAQSAAASRYEVSGIVVDADKQPLESVELGLMREGQRAQTARSGADGRFTFQDVKPGQLAVTARRLGYKATLVDIEMSASGTSSPVEIQMEEVASEVAAVIVEGSKGHLREFYEHKATNNFGKFFERKDIDARNPAFLSEILRTVSGASLSSSERFGNNVRLRGCKPMVWLDGMRAFGAELDEVARPSDVAGVEVYPSWAGIPTEYQDRDNRMCGVIVVWTRNQ